MKTNAVLCMVLIAGFALGGAGCAASTSPGGDTEAPKRTLTTRDRPVSDTLDVVVVRQPPPAPLNQVRPKRPGERHVWIPGRWAWDDARYTWIKGKWVLPERDETVWIPGRWTAVKGGWTWVPGRWKDEPPNR